MATSTEQWLAFRTPESGKQVVAALQWNVDDCHAQLDAIEQRDGFWSEQEAYDELIWRQSQASSMLKVAQKRLAEMSTK